MVQSLAKNFSHLHRSSIDLDSVELLGSLCSASCMLEDDSGDADATTGLVVSENGPLHRANRGFEIILKR